MDFDPARLRMFKVKDNGGKVYLAGPFFNDEQRASIASVEQALSSRNIPFFSPRLECLCPPDADQSMRQKAFNMNVCHVLDASLLLAVIDDRDVGTAWEMGLAYQSRNFVPIVAYTAHLNRGINLMLAEGVHGFVQGLPALEEFLEISSKSGYWELAMVPVYKGSIE
jgi:nucleoside 2-deoxyribosyltransferase